MSPIHADPIALKTARGAKLLDTSALPDLLIASLEDPTGSTGTTLFRFRKGGTASFDSRGGSVGASDTELLQPGSYSSVIDGIVLTGGSLMGLASIDGVRKVIFEERKGDANSFDFIPSVPGAVIYDYGGRTHKGADKFVYPEAPLGQALMSHLQNGFWVGRAGAGSCATCNKINQPRFGGQGAAIKTFPWGTVFVAVVLNPVGDVRFESKSFSERFIPAAGAEAENKPGKNTTLSIMITDVRLDRNSLKRVATMVHSSMAESISPFHGETDGDIHFNVSLNSQKPKAARPAVDPFTLGVAASELMKEAILNSVKASNSPIAGTQNRAPRSNR